MILVDSCVWIDLLKGKKTAAVRRLEEIQQKRTPEICINSIVYFEVLRGISSDFERKNVQRSFDLLERRDHFHAGFDHLVSLSLVAQRKGLFLPKLGDWLILKTVLDHSLNLLTSDSDFVRLQKVIPFAIERPSEGS